MAGTDLRALARDVNTRWPLRGRFVIRSGQAGRRSPTQADLDSGSATYRLTITSRVRCQRVTSNAG